MKVKLTLATILTGLIVGCSPSAEKPFTGIGVALGIDNQTLKIMQVVPNSPAARAGLVPGLTVQKIDRTETAGKPLEESVALIRGTAGTKVKLELVNADNHKTNVVELIRELVPR